MHCIVLHAFAGDRKIYLAMHGSDIFAWDICFDDIETNYSNDLFSVFRQNTYLGIIFSPYSYAFHVGLLSVLFVRITFSGSYFLIFKTKTLILFHCGMKQFNHIE